MSKVIKFNDNPVKKTQEELISVKKQLTETKTELAFYKGLINHEKAISDLLKLQVLDIESNVETLISQLNTVDNNLKGLKLKLAQVDQAVKRD